MFIMDKIADNSYSDRARTTGDGRRGDVFVGANSTRFDFFRLNIMNTKSLFDNENIEAHSSQKQLNENLYRTEYTRKIDGRLGFGGVQNEPCRHSTAQYQNTHKPTQTNTHTHTWALCTNILISGRATVRREFFLLFLFCLSCLLLPCHFVRHQVISIRSQARALSLLSICVFSKPPVIPFHPIHFVAHRNTIVVHKY